MDSGIYAILHETSGRIYIGQSRRVARRLSKHQWLLKLGRHVNPHLQRAYNKYGVSEFLFFKLETVAEDRLNLKECFWITFYQSLDRSKGYNLMSGGDAGKKCSTESKARMRAAALIRPPRAPVSAETKARLREIALARPPVSAETKAKISAARVLQVRRPHSDETKARMRTAWLTRPPCSPCSEETKARLRAAALIRPPRSEETKAKNRAAALQQWAAKRLASKALAV